MTYKNEFEAPVVRMLKDLLLLAEEGKIEGIIIGFRDSEKYCQSRWCGLTWLEEVGLAANLQDVLLRQGRG